MPRFAVSAAAVLLGSTLAAQAASSITGTWSTDQGAAAPSPPDANLTFVGYALVWFGSGLV